MSIDLSKLGLFAPMEELLEELSISNDDYVISSALFLYYRGFYKDALNLLKQIDCSQDADALRMLGEMAYIGLDDEYPKDYKKAFDYLSKAVEKGNARAGFFLGWMYISGIETERNVVMGVSLIRRAAFNGDTRSMYRMANICHNNIQDVETQDRRQEYYWYDLSIAQLRAPELFYHVQNINEVSYDIHFSWNDVEKPLGIAAAMGDYDAQRMLARHYSHNIDDKKSLMKSLYWFEKMNIDEMEYDDKNRYKKVKEILQLE